MISKTEYHPWHYVRLANKIMIISTCDIYKRIRNLKTNLEDPSVTSSYINSLVERGLNIIILTIIYRIIKLYSKCVFSCLRLRRQDDFQRHSQACLNVIIDMILKRATYIFRNIIHAIV